MATRKKSADSPEPGAKPTAPRAKPADTAKAAKPARKTRARQDRGSVAAAVSKIQKKSAPGTRPKPRLNKDARVKGTTRVGVGAQKLPVPEGSELGDDFQRKTDLHVAAATALSSVARRGRPGKKTTMSNEDRRILARAADNISPLEFAMSVMRDENESLSARRWAAEVAMPYMHHRLPVAVKVRNENVHHGVLVAPAEVPAEEWIAKYGATPADEVEDIEFKEVDLGGD